MFLSSPKLAALVLLLHTFHFQLVHLPEKEIKTCYHMPTVTHILNVSIISMEMGNSPLFRICRYFYLAMPWKLKSVAYALCEMYVLKIKVKGILY